ncbi:hypothetical protein [Bradyrhizobium zhanjiangense]|uniref:hypothetical protein n=1 Tax=Bradyrhizobium zhanjiangense TaxID=1325107 RepID=UPI0010087E8F|nr:hypothetical protein [Bradyrhizobium zhanjiangense]
MAEAAPVFCRNWIKIRLPPRDVHWISDDNRDRTGIFAATACEFANGGIAQRLWGAMLETSNLLQALAIGISNIIYLPTKCDERVFCCAKAPSRA